MLIYLCVGQYHAFLLAKHLEEIVAVSFGVGTFGTNVSLAEILLFEKIQTTATKAGEILCCVAITNAIVIFTKTGIQ